MLLCGALLSARVSFKLLELSKEPELLYCGEAMGKANMLSGTFAWGRTRARVVGLLCRTNCQLQQVKQQARDTAEGPEAQGTSLKWLWLIFCSSKYLQIFAMLLYIACFLMGIIPKKKKNPWKDPHIPIQYYPVGLACPWPHGKKAVPSEDVSTDFNFFSFFSFSFPLLPSSVWQKECLRGRSTSLKG